MISIDKLTKKRGKKLILDNVSITFNSNLNFLIGENGAGKTTMIELIAGLIKPNRGCIYLDDKKINFYNGEYKKDVGFILDLPTYPYHLKINEFINLLYYVYQIDASKNEKLKDQLILFFELNNYLDYKISDLSKGYKQRVKLLSSMLHKPKYYIYDEPFTGLDLKFKDKVFQKIIDLSSNCFFLIVSHDKDILQFKNLGTFYSIKNGNILKRFK